MSRSSDTKPWEWVLKERKEKKRKKNLSWDRWFVIYFYIQNETGNGDVLQELTKTQSKKDMQGGCGLGCGLELRRRGMT